VTVGTNPGDGDGGGEGDGSGNNNSGGAVKGDAVNGVTAVFKKYFTKVPFCQRPLDNRLL
jgi:hypothetical protein